MTKNTNTQTSTDQTSTTPTYATMAANAVTGADQITLTDAAQALIKADVASFKKDRKRYSDYVVEMEVTAETVPAHVALFREAYKVALPKANKDEVKAYATKVRNGLNYWVGKALTDDTETETDYLARILKNVDDAVTHNLNAADILKAVSAHVEGLLK